MTEINFMGAKIKCAPENCPLLPPDEVTAGHCVQCLSQACIANDDDWGDYHPDEDFDEEE